MNDNDVYIQRLIEEGAYDRDHAERAVTLIREEADLSIERMVETLIEIKTPQRACVDKPFRQQ